MHMSFKRYFFNAIISDSARKNAEKIISAQSAKKKVTATADSLRRRTAATGLFLLFLLIPIFIIALSAQENSYAYTGSVPASNVSVIDSQTVNLRGYISKSKRTLKTRPHKSKYKVHLFWETSGSVQPTHYAIYLKTGKKGKYGKVKEVTSEQAKIKLSGSFCRIKVIPCNQTQAGRSGKSIYLMTKRKNTTGIKLSRIPHTLLTGHSLRMKAGQNGNVTSHIGWTSSNSGVAAIRKGKLIALKPGDVQITARAHSGVQKSVCIKVISEYPSSISFDSSVPTEIYEGEKTMLSPAVGDAVNKSLKWSTSSKSIAKINSKGKITALKPGIVTVKAAACGPYYKKKIARAKTKITVYPLYPKSVSIVTPTSAKLDKGSVLTMQASTDKAKYTTLTWKSSKKSVATVDKNTGLLTALKPGNTTINVTAPGKNKRSLPSSSIEITVQPEVEGMVLWAEKIALNNEFGYSMNLVKYSSWKNSNLNRHCFFCDKTNSKDYDCSSFVAAAITHGETGFGNLCKKTGGCSSLYRNLIKKGWQDLGKIKPEAMQRGDIMINPASHVEIFTGKQNKIGEYLNVGAHDDYDGRSGDPSGREISIAPITWFKGSYTTVLRFSK